MEKESFKQEGDPRLVKLSEYVKPIIEKDYPLVDASLYNQDGEFCLSFVRKGAGSFIGYASFDTFEELESYLLDMKYKEWFNAGEDRNKKDFRLREGDIGKN